MDLRNRDEYNFDEMEQQKLRKIIAASVQAYCTITPLCDASDTFEESDVTFSDISSDGLSVCVGVENVSPAIVRQAVRFAKATFNGALISTNESDDDQPPSAPECDFVPSLITGGIVFSCLLIIVAVTVLCIRSYKRRFSIDREQIQAENVNGTPNKAFDKKSA